MGTFTNYFSNFHRILTIYLPKNLWYHIIRFAISSRFWPPPTLPPRPANVICEPPLMGLPFQQDFRMCISLTYGLYKLTNQNFNTKGYCSFILAGWKQYKISFRHDAPPGDNKHRRILLLLFLFSTMFDIFVQKDVKNPMYQKS